MKGGDLLQIELALQGMQQFVMNEATTMHAQQFRAARRDGGEHDIA